MSLFVIKKFFVGSNKNENNARILKSVLVHFAYGSDMQSFFIEYS